MPSSRNPFDILSASELKPFRRSQKYPKYFEWPEICERLIGPDLAIGTRYLCGDFELPHLGSGIAVHDAQFGPAATAIHPKDVNLLVQRINNFRVAYGGFILLREHQQWLARTVPPRGVYLARCLMSREPIAVQAHHHMSAAKLRELEGLDEVAFDG